MPTTESRSRFRTLLALNVALLAVLAVVTFMPEVRAQFRSRGETLVVSGNSGRSTEQILWMFDPQAMELVVVGWAQDGNGLEPLDRRPIQADVEALRRSR